MPGPANPSVDQRTICIFLSLAKVSDFMKHARRRPLRAFHSPHVDAGQDVTKPWNIFVVTEKCIGRDGRRCQNHGLEFAVQLTDKQRVQGLFKLLQLEPFPYDSQPLMDYCVRYVSALHHLLPQRNPIPPRASRLVEGTAVGSGSVSSRSASHHARYRSWVSALIPSSDTTTRTGHRGSLAVAEVSTPCTSFAVTVTFNNVVCYTKNAQPPVRVEVEAKKKDHMLYVSLRQPAILSAFGLKARVRHLDQKLHIYDAFGDKWFHSPADMLWLRLNVQECLILKASHIRLTLGLEQYVAKSLTKPFLPGSDPLAGFLASARASLNPGVPAFCAVPPLTVMVATIPEHDVPHSAPTASSSSDARTSSDSVTPSARSHDSGNTSTRTTKKQKRNNGTPASTSREIVEISSDEESVPPSTQPAQGEQSSVCPRKRLIVHPPEPKPLLPRLRGPTQPTYTYWKLIPRAKKPTVNPEVIVVSDDESPSAQSHTQSAVRSSFPSHAPIPSSSRRPVIPTDREVVNISDNEEVPTQVTVARTSTSSGPSAPIHRGFMSHTDNVGAAGPSAGHGHQALGGRRHADKGKGKMRAKSEDENDSDSDADSDATLV